MCSAGLLNVNEQTIISSGDTVHQRNWLLLEYIRHMNLQVFIEFCKLLEVEWPEISSQLLTGMYVSTSIQ